ncbi:SpoIIE family protein phosphatase [Nocardioides sp. CER19]|uniref:PP2C family protein-serine/threonine phosphatase n=1 Tax=Nocardioides sp. CER19 TaxID=3038538 RepID=UPI0024479A7C|nr:SpoIIE family protein phosphatase [Nocardioides sp. CER19]MDH2414446.1 SpoIIE family protein phosphatase [Nocardioides sp. CER19]
MSLEADRSAVPTAVHPGWASAPSPALLVDVDGVVLAANDAALLVLPHSGPGRELADCVPGWLAEAHRSTSIDLGRDAVAGSVGERTFTATSVRVPDGSSMWWLTETTDVTRLQDELRTERERTTFLRTASDDLLSSLNVVRTMEVAAELAAARLADVAWVIEPEVRGRHATAVCVRGQRARAVTLDIHPHDLPGLAEALQGFPPVPSRWIDPALAPEWVLPDSIRATGSMVVTALPGHGVPAGALILLRSTEAQPFSESEEAVARLFAARVGAALSAARLFEEQSAITEVLTAGLLPPALQRVDGVDFAGIYRPAQDTSRLGGDFYDVHPLEGGGSLALLGDVCGKGLEAAVLTGKIRNTMQALLPMAGDHLRMLDLLNAALLSTQDPRFATMVLASAVRVGEQVRLSLTRAGHLPPLIIRADGRVEEVFGRGSLVGVLPVIDGSTEQILLDPGETCLLYTDGIIEARGGPLGDEMFGEARLRRALAGCAGMPAEAMVAHVLMLATEWLGGASHDDMAVLAIAAPVGSDRRAPDGDR